MSRPYLKINSISYVTTGNVLTLNSTYYKLRSSTPSSRTLTLSGFSASVTYTESFDSVDHTGSVETSGIFVETLTFSVPTFGTQSSTTYNPSTLTYNFGGTAYALPSLTQSGTSLSFVLNGVQLGIVTASTTIVSAFLSSVASTLTLSGANANYTVVANGNSLVFTSPLYGGNVYNGVTVSMTVVNGASGGASFTYSLPLLGTFSNGTNNYPVTLSYTPLNAVSTYTYVQGS